LCLLCEVPSLMVGSACSGFPYAACAINGCGTTQPAFPTRHYLLCITVCRGAGPLVFEWLIDDCTSAKAILPMRQPVYCVAMTPVGPRPLLCPLQHMNQSSAAWAINRCGTTQPAFSPGYHLPWIMCVVEHWARWASLTQLEGDPQNPVVSSHCTDSKGCITQPAADVVCCYCFSCACTVGSRS